MVNMKKIVGILLALCFVLSVTAASAAASGDNDREHREKPGDHGKPKFDDRHKPKFDDRHKPKFNDHQKKRHHHPAHWEKKRVGHREFRHGQWTMVYVYKMVYVAEYYDWHSY